MSGRNIHDETFGCNGSDILHVYEKGCGYLDETAVIQQRLNDFFKGLPIHIRLYAAAAMQMTDQTVFVVFHISELAEGDHLGTAFYTDQEMARPLNCEPVCCVI